MADGDFEFTVPSHLALPTLREVRAVPDSGSYSRRTEDELEAPPRGAIPYEPRPVWPAGDVGFTLLAIGLAICLGAIVGGFAALIW